MTPQEEMKQIADELHEIAMFYRALAASMAAGYARVLKEDGSIKMMRVRLGQLKHYIGIPKGD